MKYRPKSNSYTNSTGSNEYFVAENLATSYGWWEYCKIIKGKRVFNCYSYSNTTSKHQSDLLQLFRDKNIHIDLYLESPEGLQDLESSRKHYLSKITALRTAIQAPRSRKVANARRAGDINSLQLKLLELKELRA